MQNILKSKESKTIMSELAKNVCIACSGGIPPLKGPAIKKLLRQLGANWKVIKNHHIEKDYSFKNFKEALAFTNRVGKLAEQQGHHPDILLGWGRVKITLWTHKINGLTESDFILAAKADQLL